MKTRQVLLIGCLAAAGIYAAHPVDISAHEIDNVAVFARLYGVVRYFYPSDLAANLDWDRFAIHGVRRTRPARETNKLKTTLQDLFRPLGPGIEIGARMAPVLTPRNLDGPLIAWRYLGVPFGWPNAPTRDLGGKRTHRPTIRDRLRLNQTVPAETLRGKTLRLRGLVRASASDTSGVAALVLLVMRGGNGLGFTGNMRSRPTEQAEWREYSIQGMVDEDATEVTVQLLAAGAVTADFDAIELAVREGSGTWTPVPLKDAGFEAPADQDRGAWMRIPSPTGPVEISRLSFHAPEGRQFLRIAPSLSGADKELFDEAAPKPGTYVDIDLGAGLRARVATVLTDSEARADAQRRNPLDAMLRSIPEPSDGTPDLDVRLADVVVAWNAFRHFYPYWRESSVDWDGRLRPRLMDAYNAASRSAHANVLRRLVADARDGHGRVIDTFSESWACPLCPLGRSDRATLTVQFGLASGRVVILASSVPAEAPAGAVVSTIDGVPAGKMLAEAMSLVSGSPQWKTVRALQDIASCTKGATIRAVIDAGTGPREIRLRCDATEPPAEKRPESPVELASEVWYVDLTRARMAEIRPMLGKLAQARAVVFDMRGYPADPGSDILTHLIDQAETDRWMHVAMITGPFGQVAGWQDAGYDLKPAQPHLSGKIVFLTDARAISAAEGRMGYVVDRRLGTIIGSATAGTNGNVVTFAVPGGFDIKFTGLRVTRHDGQTPFHLIGVQPDIAVTQTITGLRNGRDEVLDRAIELIRKVAR